MTTNVHNGTLINQAKWKLWKIKHLVVSHVNLKAVRKLKTEISGKESKIGTSSAPAGAWRILQRLQQLFHPNEMSYLRDGMFCSRALPQSGLWCCRLPEVLCPYGVWISHRAPPTYHRPFRSPVLYSNAGLAFASIVSHPQTPFPSWCLIFPFTTQMRKSVDLCLCSSDCHGDASSGVHTTL